MDRLEKNQFQEGGSTSRKKKRKIPWSMLYIAATIVAVLLFGVFNRKFGDVFRTIGNLTPGFLTLAILVSLVYFLFEGEIFRLLLRSQGYRIRGGRTGGEQKRGKGNGGKMAVAHRGSLLFK